jgi:hypothetical protein
MPAMSPAESGLMQCRNQRAYSITSSARLSIIDEIVTSISFATCRLITNSNSSKRKSECNDPGYLGNDGGREGAPLLPCAAVESVLHGALFNKIKHPPKKFRLSETQFQLLDA